jgi:SNF family Na+-dependent transporter
MSLSWRLESGKRLQNFWKICGAHGLTYKILTAVGYCVVVLWVTTYSLLCGEQYRGGGGGGRYCWHFNSTVKGWGGQQIHLKPW